MTDILDKVPMPLLVLDTQDNILSTNRAARKLGFEQDTTAANYFKGLSESFIDSVRYQSSTHVYHLKNFEREKRCLTIAEQTGDAWYVWLQDITEQLALAEQLNRLRQPNNRQTRKIHQTAVTGIGYAELVEVILDDSDSLTGDKIATLGQYHREVTRSHSRILKLLRNERQDLPGGQISKLVVVVDGHEALTELITELLRTEGYKVAAFTDADSALTYCSMNAESIGQVLADESLADRNGRPMLECLNALMPDFRVIRLTSQSGDGNSVQKPVDFQQLLDTLDDNGHQIQGTSD